MLKLSLKTQFKNLRNLEFRRKRKFSRQTESEKIEPKTPETPPNIQLRLFTVWGVLMMAMVGLVFNLYQLQIVQGKKLTKKARNQQMVNVRPYMPRRPVVDRDNNILAIDRPVYTVYSHPKLFNLSQEQIAEKIAPIIGKEKADLVKTFQNKRSGILLASGVSEDITDKLISLRLNGFEFIQKYSRFYPQDDLVADVVGYVNLDRRGQAGVEYSQEKLLERSGQTVRMSKSGDGSLMPNYVTEGFLNSDDLKLQLTIDSRLQRVARAALKEQMTKFSAKRGAVIVMDAVDGSLLALVSQPTYNPNQYAKSDISLFKNWTVADLYEPGSTFKPVNVAIALENGTIKPDDTFEDPGSIKIGTHTIKNAEKTGYRRLTIPEILQTSSNIGMVRIIQRLKPSIYYNWLERLGLGQKVETDLPFEVSGQLKSQEKFISSAIEPATTSFGQGFSLTPLQLVQLQGALANGGKLVTPHVVRGLIDTKGGMHYSLTLPEPRQIFSPTTTQKVVEMMETVVSSGTGKAARISGYRIGGKTGTAEKASPNGGYIKGARITSFVAILPVESPRYVVFAVVDEPKGENAYGSTVAAPIVKTVMESLIPIEQIPPSQEKVIGH
ncbi:penicillin-binding protein 2 [Dolichospermum sp. LEGE 00240]|jgi:cell division protein FtsI (penicillin-binding protein 3)|uniref:peptidoglycan D,D-transpeptidase FtsI family protein n=1 Tax=Dolichospermum sp. LEGE 00240 TaxID=1828603 RepID=UPI001881218B|nr:penicillin-binding protein 2 [Dolichospermum sp. LEGE 00240]MBE9251053.1 penicillin-binding protein 2 [Dolichospermum sp. LEGE 00240]MDM3845478.1 penicillin-binding protein 2 [Aphanizomenon gracile PMC638.10]MDM3852288.1 penicillin-binding protein 2 [Aphanizomenon gracile PMC627.10]MDM3856076.1 penicillin-binding protein 2 [Aphanizomenon gracile PMC649.10]